MENHFKFLRKITEKHYNDLGIFKSDIKLDPNTLVDDLEISTRLKKVLKNHNVLNVKGINELKTINYIHFEGMGEKTIMEFERFTYKYQLGTFYKD